MSKPSTIDAYLATIPAEAAEMVNKIRQIIQKAAPTAEEGLSYGIGGFKQNGRYFIYYSGYKNTRAFIQRHVNMKILKTS
ncbi:DUF1801 domain-containing protein [Niabella sp. W65]|nr:DUF1801 domain-containing protein [Niabella sp. W65]MCH7367821.1 DUF1801 domain-containing protein [Niabella sp. W65]